LDEKSEPLIFARMLSKQINNDNNNNWDKKKIKIVKG
jgi:hypothetical protein